MRRLVVRVDAVTITGLDRAGAAALPAHFEAAVRRAIERASPLVEHTSAPLARGTEGPRAGRPSLARGPAGRVARTADVSQVRARIDGGPGVGPEQVGNALAEAIDGAVHGRGAGR